MSSRSVAERMNDVRRLIAAAQTVYAQRTRWVPALAESTGLSPEGVGVGFSCLERDASNTELRALVAAAGDADAIHVVLSSNVFVAPLRALAMARAASQHVTVRPSPRDPTLTHALIEAAADESITVIGERDVALTGVSEIHVYGRGETLAAVRARARVGVVVHGHGPGMGIAIVTRAADVAQAVGAIAEDVVPFDQRGCLSPRVVLVEGSAARGEQVARALDAELARWAARVPRGALLDEERAEVRRWADSLAFAGTLWWSQDHAVALTAHGVPLALAPAGRHVHVASIDSLSETANCLAPFARFIVAVGTDDAARTREVAPRHARLSPLGRMQRPALDGWVDMRVSRS